MRRRPEEVDAAQEAEEQRRVAERRQRAADVRDQEDEEHDDVDVVRGCRWRAAAGRIITIDAPVVPIRLASIAPMRQQRRVHGRRAVDVARNEDAARHGEQRQQQQDERHVFEERRVRQRRRSGGRSVPWSSQRDQDEQRPDRGDLALVMLPAWAQQQRTECDREQDADERERPDEAEACAVQPLRGLSRPGLHKHGGCHRCGQDPGVETSHFPLALG